MLTKMNIPSFSFAPLSLPDVAQMLNVQNTRAQGGGPGAIVGNAGEDKFRGIMSSYTLPVLSGLTLTGNPIYW